MRLQLSFVAAMAILKAFVAAAPTGQYDALALHERDEDVQSGITSYKRGEEEEDVKPYVNSQYKRAEEEADKIAPYVNSLYKREEGKEEKIAPYVNSLYKREEVETEKIAPFINLFY